jgi:hypothetical protein
MKKGWSLFMLSIFVWGGAIFAILWPALSPAQSKASIQSQETNFSGLKADLTECQRKGGVLTIKVRLANHSPKTVRAYWQDVKKNAYLMDEANSKKYFLLKDAKGEYIYSGDPWDIHPNSSKTSWFKFSAPPKEVKKITVVLPNCMPFEDVPIQDK